MRHSETRTRCKEWEQTLITPGARQLTRIPMGSSSFAATLVMPRSAVLQMV